MFLFVDIKKIHTSYVNKFTIQINWLMELYKNDLKNNNIGVDRYLYKILGRNPICNLHKNKG